MAKRCLAMILAAVMTAAVLTGCGATPQTPDTPAQPTPDTQADPPRAESTELTVYSSHDVAFIEKIFQMFEEETGIHVNYVSDGTGTLLNRIDAEQENPQCDIMWGGATDSMGAYKYLFQEYHSPEEAYLTDTNVFDGYYVGFSSLPLVIMYNKAMVGDDVPTSWNDLTDGKWLGKVAYCNPSNSGSAFTTVCTEILAMGGPEGGGWDYMERQIKNLDNKILGGSGEVTKMIYDGEMAMGVTLECNVFYYVDENGELTDVGLVYPEEGTSAVPDTVAIVKDCQHLDAAQKFIDFAIGKEVQELVVSDMNRRPVRVDVEPPAGLTPVDQIKFIPYDEMWASVNASEIKDTVNDMIDAAA